MTTRHRQAQESGRRQHMRCGLAARTRAGVAALGVRLYTWGELAPAMKSWGWQVGTLRPQGGHRAFPEQPPYFCGSGSQG